MNRKNMVGLGSAVFASLLSPFVAAQTTEAPAAEAAPAAEPAAPASAEASGSVSLGTSGASAEGDADAVAPEDDSERFEAIHHQFELGVLLGILLPSKDHNIRDENARHEEYAGLAPVLGLRASYFPFKYLGAEFEGVWSPTSTENDGTASLFAGRGHLIAQIPIGRFTPFLVGGGGAIGGGSSSMGTDTDPLVHFGLGAKYAFSEGFGLRLDLRDNVTQKFNADQGEPTHNLEALLGLQFALEMRGGKEPPPPPPADTDNDGFVDSSDRCPNEPGIAPEGCPDKDSDGDTILDSKDACPTEAGSTSACGCAVKDQDGDSIPDEFDKCPAEFGLMNGCPDPDPDHDGIKNPDDKCPNQPELKNGFEDTDGCPDEIPEKIRKFTGVIKGIEFDTGKDTIRPISEGVLDGALVVLNEYPALRIEISGHTDNVGSPETNIDLSKRRAESVKNWFVNKGVSADRIETRGAGPDEPIADNKTAAGKQKNRRIEFKLIQPAGAVPVPAPVTVPVQPKPAAAPAAPAPGGLK
jgi:outer membrane protein OmpA-like peptidoglycan-associated protein